MPVIKVEFETLFNRWHIAKMLKKLNKFKILSFDTETRPLYSKTERKEAKKFLKQEGISVDHKSLALQVAANTGLSFPSLVSVTHFIFGLSEDASIVIVCDNPRLELFLWQWIAQYQGTLLIHNSLFDLKLMYHRVGVFPKCYEDTALLAKCLTNNADVWKSKVGLKDLMGTDYDPMWSLYNEYEPDSLKDPKFLTYCSIDGAATIKLWNDIQKYMEN